jgi:hypothetical protein
MIPHPPPPPAPILFPPGFADSPKGRTHPACRTYPRAESVHHPRSKGGTCKVLMGMFFWLRDIGPRRPEPIRQAQAEASSDATLVRCRGVRACSRLRRLHNPQYTHSIPELATPRSFRPRPRQAHPLVARFARTWPHQPPTVNHQPPTINHQPTSPSKTPKLHHSITPPQQPSPTNPQPPTPNPQPSTNPSSFFPLPSSFP